MTSREHFIAKALKPHPLPGKIVRVRTFLKHYYLKGDAGMNVQMMDGLLGASSNIKLAGTPMSVYRQASAEDDTEKMKRALGYTGECTEKAVKYQEKLDEGMKAEAKDEREKAELEQEAAVEKRQEEHKRGPADRLQGTDLVQISEAAKDNKPAEAAEPIDSEPVIYTPAGEASAVPVETEANISFTA